MAIRDVGGHEVLINLLDTDEPKCKVSNSHSIQWTPHSPTILVDFQHEKTTLSALSMPYSDNLFTPLTVNFNFNNIEITIQPQANCIRYVTIISSKVVRI